MKTLNIATSALVLSVVVCAQTKAPTTGAPASAAAAAGSIGAVVFNSSGNLEQDGNNFVWDDANNRLGLGTNSPFDRLDILNGNIRFNSGSAGAEAVNLAGRIGVGIPVPYFTPTINNSVIAFDVYPKGNPSNFSTNTGVAWFDLCSTDVNLNRSGYECLRMGKFLNGDAHVSAAKGGTGVVRNLDLQINGGNVGVGTTSPVALLSVGASSQFRVSSSGNITRLNNVPTNFPVSNAAGYLTNDGSGNFYYTPINSTATFTAATLPSNVPTGTITRISDAASISDCRSGSGTVQSSCEWNGNTWVFHPTGGYVLGSQPGTIAGGATLFAAPGVSTLSPSEPQRQYVVAKACRISNMYMNIGTDQPASGDVVVTLRVASSGSSAIDTDVSAIVPAGAPAGTVVFDKTHSVDLAAGDLVSLKVVNSASAEANLVTVNLYCAY